MAGSGYRVWKLVGLCVNSNVERGKEFAARYGVAEVFTDPVTMLDRTKPDLVDVITTPQSHAHLVGLTAARNIPAICQKPLAPKEDEAEAMIASAERAGALLVAHENWRWKPWNRKSADCFDPGRSAIPIASRSACDREMAKAHGPIWIGSRISKRCPVC